MSKIRSAISYLEDIIMESVIDNKQEAERHLDIIKTELDEIESELNYIESEIRIHVDKIEAVKDKIY